jgi:hypothetical protein
MKVWNLIVACNEEEDVNWDQFCEMELRGRMNSLYRHDVGLRRIQKRLEGFEYVWEPFSGKSVNKMKL